MAEQVFLKVLKARCNNYERSYVYEFLRGGWSFLCIYADTLKEAEEMFWRQMTEFVQITKVECE